MIPTEEDTLRHQRLQIFGRVQGVYYRASTQQEAERLGLAGWVKNRADGSVEAEVHGPTPAVAALLAWCQHGPPGARVERVVVTECPPVDGVGFQIVRD
ncbi:MAG: acylphosphatase [Magnetococcales bacterium]|nr:acylphosphatase [Magnetococcales bacterium]